MVTLNPADPLAEDFRSAVSAEISAFLDQRQAALAPLGAETDELIRLARDFTASGKRLRPAFCAWGYAAATGRLDLPTSVIRAAASLDLLHVAALIHDDVMDDSATRRGLAAVHVQFANLHQTQQRQGSAEAFGRAGAILLGDLLLVWSQQLFDDCGAAEQLVPAARLAAQVREEVNAGQFLDVSAQTRSALDARTDPDSVTDQIRRVVEFKTARYTVIRPLQIGATLGGGTPQLRELLAGYGSPLGRGFQFRDDILGVYGDEAVTGKPAGDDLREGKLTVLVANAMANASDADAHELAGILGHQLTAAKVTRARKIIACSGALAATEAEISACADQAVHALADDLCPAPVRAGLTALVELATQRQS